MKFTPIEFIFWMLSIPTVSSLYFYGHASNNFIMFFGVILFLRVFELKKAVEDSKVE
jgi:hypothetical protein